MLLCLDESIIESLRLEICAVDSCKIGVPKMLSESSRVEALSGFFFKGEGDDNIDSCSCGIHIDLDVRSDRDVVDVVITDLLSLEEIPRTNTLSSTAEDVVDRRFPYGFHDDEANCLLLLPLLSCV